MFGATTRTGAFGYCTLAALVATLLLATEAAANTASPLMFMRIRYLLWANIIIAAVEAAVVCAIFKTRPSVTFALLLVANYLSAWVGLLFFGRADGAGLIYAFFDDPVLQMRQIFWTCVGLALLASLALEWPCFTAALPKARRSWGRGLRAALVGQLVSYTCCGMWMGGVTLPGIGVRPDETLAFAPRDAPVWVYYIDGQDQHIHRVRLDGSQREFILEAPFIGARSLIGAYRESDDEPWQLWQSSGGRAEPRMLLDDFAVHAGALIDWNGPQHPSYWSRVFPPHIIDLRAEDGSPWSYQYEYYRGLRAEREDELLERFGFDTPFGSWQPLAVSILPGEIVIFELVGRVVIWDVEGRRYGVLARGRSPVVAYEHAPGAENR